MKQLSKRTFILAGLQLRSGGQASRQQQASSPQAPVDRIRLLCSRLLLLLRENEKVSPAAWQGALSPHTRSQMGEHMHVRTVHTTTHVHTCRHMQTRYRHKDHINIQYQPSIRTANVFNKTFICRIYCIYCLYCNSDFTIKALRQLRKIFSQPQT